MDENRKNMQAKWQANNNGIIMDEFSEMLGSIYKFINLAGKGALETSCKGMHEWSWGKMARDAVQETISQEMQELPVA